MNAELASGRLHKPRKCKGRNRNGGWGRKTVSETACNKANDMVNVYCIGQIFRRVAKPQRIVKSCDFRVLGSLPAIPLASDGASTRANAANMKMFADADTEVEGECC